MTLECTGLSGAVLSLSSEQGSWDGTVPRGYPPCLVPCNVVWEAPLSPHLAPPCGPLGRELSLLHRALECRVEASRPASGLGRKGVEALHHFLTAGGTPGLGAGICVALQEEPGAELGLGTQLLPWRWCRWGSGGRPSSPTVQTLPVLCL